MKELNWGEEKNGVWKSEANGFEYSLTYPEGPRGLLALQISWGAGHSIEQRGHAYTDGAKSDCQSHADAVQQAIDDASEGLRKLCNENAILAVRKDGVIDEAKTALEYAHGLIVDDEGNLISRKPDALDVHILNKALTRLAQKGKS